VPGVSCGRQCGVRMACACTLYLFGCVGVGGGGGGGLRACVRGVESLGIERPRAAVTCGSASNATFARLYRPAQLQYCLIDQLLHGPQPPTGAAAERAIAGLMEEHSALGWHPGCHPHIR
jgi:hypothetical protein